MNTKTAGATVGENLRRVRIRAGESQAECAARVAGHGLAWSRDNVAALEGGRRAEVNVSELFILSAAYGLPVSDWFAGDGDVQLTATTRASRSDMREVLQ
ncbi:helix-turn-helix domain-containing protein, partial [Bacillus safensis]|uniref:helix-turn-helix domain-containing protein n=1 Tax=Bacillus safensis TaxID=561879 RepID=UPI003649567E